MKRAIEIRRIKASAVFRERIVAGKQTPAFGRSPGALHKSRQTRPARLLCALYAMRCAEWRESSA
jgi:hypothetical protein